MSSRHDLGRQLRGYGEIREIMGAMKNLALLEMRKLSRFIEAQRRAVEVMDAAAADWLQFHRGAAQARRRRRVCVLLGSERGFCGDFNESLVAALETLSVGAAADAAPQELALIAVGYRLAPRLADDPRVVAFLDGASVVEEVEAVLAKLADAIAALRGDRDLGLIVLHHAPDRSGVQIATLEPFRGKAPAPAYATPPVLYLAPEVFMRGLASHYLFASLHELFFSSLLAENQRRYQHMDQAIQHLQEDCRRLELRRNQLRQEEITEEIEVILLGAAAGDAS